MNSKLKYIRLILLPLCGYFFSCGNNENPVPDEERLTSIILKVNKPEIVMGTGDAFEFVVTGSNQTNVADKSEFFIDGKKISSNKYKPDKAGTYKVQATYKNLRSNIITIKALNEKRKLRIVMRKNALTNMDISFSVFDEKNNNVTFDSKNTKYTVNGVPLLTPLFKKTKPGKYTVQATHKGDKTSANIDIFSPKYTTKILVEDYTGTECAYCPRLTKILEELVKKNKNFIPVAIHGQNSAQADPFIFKHLGFMQKQFLGESSAAPLSRYNRKIDWREDTTILYKAQKSSVGLGLAISSTRTNRSLSMEIKVGFDLDFSKKLALVVYLLEDGLVFPQANATKYYGGANPIINFVHNDVLREAYTHVLGDNIPAEFTKRSKIYSREFDVKIPDEVKDLDKLRIVAFVTYDKQEEASKKLLVINTQESKVGENKNFD